MPAKQVNYLRLSKKTKLCELLYLQQEDAISHTAFHSEKYEEQYFLLQQP